VVKADGLAAGKGVILCPDVATATAAAAGMLSGRDFGAAGRRIIVEEMLFGREASFFVLSDGERFVELATCQDYKRAEDGDGGKNTGGMGTYSPSAHLDDAIRHRVLREIVEPTVREMKAEGNPYSGVLYIGLMLTGEGPKVLEYNCRFGDPEAQVLLPRLDGDWFELMNACALGRLEGIEPRWIGDAAVCVVMSSGGYPDRYEKGKIIHGLEEAAAMPGVVVFHAGTGLDGGGNVVTAGGRVLGVTALGGDIGAARDLAYEAVSRIGWDGERHRSDIAADAVEKSGSPA
jgi:phosphoribosylamine--glycine ligase